MSGPRRVIIESPFAPADSVSVAEHIEYARRALRNALDRGEAPIASHLLYTQPGVLDDLDDMERDMGIRSGFAWREVAEATAVYIDYGTSRGMMYGIDDALLKGQPVEYRQIGRNNPDMPLAEPFPLPWQS